MKIRDCARISDSSVEESTIHASMQGLREEPENPIKPMPVAEFVREYTDNDGYYTELFRVSQRVGKYSYIACIRIDNDRGHCVQIRGAYRTGEIGYDKYVGNLWNSLDICEALKVHGYLVTAH